MWKFINDVRDLWRLSGIYKNQGFSNVDKININNVSNL